MIMKMLMRSLNIKTIHCSWSLDTRNLLVGFWHLEEKKGKNMLDNSTTESAGSCGSTMLQSYPTGKSEFQVTEEDPLNLVKRD